MTSTASAGWSPIAVQLCGSPFWGLLAGLLLVAILNFPLTRRALARPGDAR